MDTFDVRVDRSAADFAARAAAVRRSVKHIFLCTAYFLVQNEFLCRRRLPVNKLFSL
jgi:hypothetical protein